MGCFVNPPDESKEKWVSEHGTPIMDQDQLDSFDWNDITKRIILLVNNGAFRALGVLYSKKEFTRAAAPLLAGRDVRPYLFFTAKTEELEKVSPLKTYWENRP